MAFNEYFNAAMAPAQNYLSGQESGMRNHLMMQQMQQAQAQAEQQAAAQEQQGLYQNLLAEYLGPEVAGQARPPERQAQILNQLFAMNPQATNELVQFQGGQQEQQTAQSRAQAERAYLQAQHVKASKNPVAALRLIPAMGETNPVRALMEAYGLETEEEITDDMARAMADRVMEMTGPDAGIEPEVQEPLEISGGQAFFQDPNGGVSATDITGYREPASNVNMQRVSGIVAGEDAPSMMIFDPRSGAYMRELPDGTRERIPGSNITEVSVQGGASDVIPATRRDDLVAERDWIDLQRQGLSEMIDVVADDPALVGVPGQIRRAGQQFLGMASDVASLLGQAGAQNASNMVLEASRIAQDEIEKGNLTEDQFERLFNDPNLSELALFENTLGFTLARLRSPDGRILSDTLRRSMQDAKVTGLTSSGDVRNKLSSILRQLDHRSASLGERLGEAPSRPADQSIDELLQMYAPER